MKKIEKRDGEIKGFDLGKIIIAVEKAFIANGIYNHDTAEKIAAIVDSKLNYETPVPVEVVQDTVENVLIDEGYRAVAKAYGQYRAERTRVRDKNSRLMQKYDEITFKSAKESDCKRNNGNVDGDSAMGTMLAYGSEGAKAFNEMCVLNPVHSKAHRDGDIHIHDLDFLTLTLTCCQIWIKKLLKDGFGTGHGFLREPSNIQSAAALVCIAIQCNQNDQHGGQSIPDFDYGLAPYVAKSYIKELFRIMDILIEDDERNLDELKDVFKTYLQEKEFIMNPEGYKFVEDQLISKSDFNIEEIHRIMKKTYAATEKATYQAMESLVHNLNTMHSRAGAQIPFSSINYGTDTSEEGRMVMRNVLLAQNKGLGKGETPIFPIHIFKVKSGINYEKGDPNYDLFKLACKVSAKRLFPNFSFLDAPFNAQYYKEGKPETEVAYMGCRTRVIGNAYDPEREIANGRGNLSFTSINLPRLAIEAKKEYEAEYQEMLNNAPENLEKLESVVSRFFKKLDQMQNLVIDQLLERMEIQSRKLVKNFPFLMGQHIWIDSEKLSIDDEIREVIKHGTLAAGFIGLPETLVALIGKHHGESQEAYELGLAIVKYMRERMDEETEKRKLNFSLLATPAEGLSGRFLRMDQKRYGIIPGVTDKEYYTNSFHIPVGFQINAFDKIRKEAPFHALTNGGHITYVELDGDPLKNLDAFESIVRCMKESGVGYGSINHPVDRDPVCGYTGIIDNECPCCHRKESEDGVSFERIRRITGYLVGTLDRFNDAKRAEEKDRIKHTIPTIEKI